MVEIVELAFLYRLRIAIGKIGLRYQNLDNGAGSCLQSPDRAHTAVARGDLAGQAAPLADITIISHGGPDIFR